MSLDRVADRAIVSSAWTLDGASSTAVGATSSRTTTCLRSAELTLPASSTTVSVTSTRPGVLNPGALNCGSEVTTGERPPTVQRYCTTRPPTSKERDAASASGAPTDAADGASRTAVGAWSSTTVTCLAAAV